MWFSNVLIWSIHLSGKYLVPVWILVIECFMQWVLNVECMVIPCCGACTLGERCNCWAGESFTLALSHCFWRSTYLWEGMSVLPQHLEVVCKDLSRVGGTCIKLEMFTSWRNEDFMEKTLLLIYSVFGETCACNPEGVPELWIPAVGRIILQL